MICCKRPVLCNLWRCTLDCGVLGSCEYFMIIGSTCLCSVAQIPFHPDMFEFAALWAVSPDCVGFGHCSMQLSIFCIPTYTIIYPLYSPGSPVIPPKKISTCCVVVVVPFDYDNYRVVRIATLLVDPPL